MFRFILWSVLAGLGCGGSPNTSGNPECNAQFAPEGCENGLICCGDGLCRDRCEGPDTILPDVADTTDTSDTSDTTDTVDTNDTADTTETVDTADTADTTDTRDTTDTGPVDNTIVLVDPGIHTLGGVVSGGGILLLDARLDGASRVCNNNLCVIGGIAP